MPMNARLLRPIVSGDPDARRYIAAVQQADGNTLEPAVRKAITDFVTGCKADGIWSAIKACCLLAGPRTLAGINVPLVGPTPTFNAFTASDYDRETGLIGNASTMYINSGRPGGGASGDPQDNNHLAVWVSALTSGIHAYIGNGATGTGSNNIFRNAGNHVARSRSATSDTIAAVATGFLGMSRAAAGSFAARTGGANFTIARTSESPVTTNVHVFARTNVGVPTSYSDSRLAFYSIGEALDLALLDARVSAYVTAIGAAI